MKYPFIKQQENKDCGVASLAMIIKYYNGNIDLETIRLNTFTDKAGTTAYHLIKYARSLGFEADGIKVDILTHDIKLPCIAHVIANKSYKHFIVIYEIDKENKSLLIADPMNKIRKISFDEYKSISSNIYITLNPINKIPYYKQNSISDLLKNFIVNNKELVLHILILSLVSTITMICFSYFMEFSIGSINLVNSHNHLVAITIIFSTIVLIKKISDYFKNILLAYIGYKIDYESIEDIYDKIVHLPYSYFYNHTTGEIVSKISNLEVIKDIISKLLFGLIITISLSTLAIFCLYFISKTLFIVAIISFIAHILLVYLFSNILDDKIKKLYESKMQFYSYLIESISAYQTIKGLNVLNGVINKFKLKKEKYLADNYHLNLLVNKQILIKDIIDNMAYISIIIVGCFLVINNQLKISSLLTFNILYSYYIEPIKDLLEMNLIFKQGKEVINNMSSFNIKNQSAGFINKLVEGNIVFNNLSFNYKNNTILKDINLTINKSDKVLITGSSGSGKSTLLKLIKRYYDSNIILDDININDYSESSINESISLVSQNELLFNDTIMNNLILFSNIKPNKILEISKLCELDFIDNDLLRYDYMIEENGNNLSGGQKQRLVLARALLKNSNIYLLDEALNQVDHNMERNILLNMFDKYKTKTIIYVSHKDNNKDLFNKHFVLENGYLYENS